MKQDELEVQKLKDENAIYENEVKAQKEKEEKAAKEKTDNNNNFWKQVKESEDPFDNLGGLAQHIHDNIGSTGVYIGQLEPKVRKIKDDDDEKAHLDLDSPEIIKFKFANSDHQDLIVGTTLKRGQGISHDVFADSITQHNEKIQVRRGTDIVE